MEKEKFLRSALENLTQYYYDSFVRQCAEEKRLIGVGSLITRQQMGVCCAWCQKLVGTYEYAKGRYPEDIFRRHQNCRCMVTVKTDKRGYTDVWSKKTYETRREAVQARIEELEQESTGMDELVKEYFRKADPGEGKVHVDDRYKPLKDHKERMEIAEWTHNTLGGNIDILPESADGEKLADYLWRGKDWELKTVSSENASKSALGKGIRQIFIRNNPGGIILNFGDKTPDLDELWENLQCKLNYYGYIKENFDVMVISKNTLVKVYRIKAK